MDFPRLISFEEALDILRKVELSPLGVQSVHFKDSLNRILAQDIIANENIPPVPTAAMDGYACNHKDVNLLREKGLELLTLNKAGNPTRPTLKQGCMIKTFTGSQMPLDSDTLVIVEHTYLDNNRVYLHNKDTHISAGQWIRHTGDNYKKGDILLKKGDKIGAFELGLLAELNMNFVLVYQKVRVGIICIGDEIVEVGQISQNPNVVRSVNAHLLEALVRQMGQEAIIYPLLNDDKASIYASYQIALQECDMLLTSGGMSMGDYDYTQDIMAELTHIHFKGVRLKPGKPVAFGSYPKIKSKQNIDDLNSKSATMANTQQLTQYHTRHTLVLGLPGFPNSCGVTFLLFGTLLISRLQHRQYTIKTFQATLREDLKRTDTRKEFRACDVHFENGSISVSFSSKKSLQSSMINNLTHNTALAILEEQGSDLSAGDVVQIVFLDDLTHF